MVCMIGKLFIVSACSGAGKTTLVTQVIKQLAANGYSISRVITYTSKEPRANEVNGIDYHFISVQEFEQRIKDGFFLEWSNAYGPYYGSPLSLIQELEAGASSLLIVDLVGARSIAKKVDGAVLIWLSVKNIDSLKKRLFMRNTENFDQITQRLVRAHEELHDEQALEIFNYTVMNERLENALSELKFIIKSELAKQ